VIEEHLPARLFLLGLHGVSRVVTHANRSVMVSIGKRRVLRIHAGYAYASDSVLRAIIRFLDPRLPRAIRRAAERELLAFPAEEYAASEPAQLRQERPRPGDLLLLHRLSQAFDRFNRDHFGGKLSSLPIRLSGRMRTRLGELSVDIRTGQPIEIAISRRHLARHGWSEVEHTLLHEMVHQWQAESGLPVDHGPLFREKARQVGVVPGAKRTPEVSGGAGRRNPPAGRIS
jgi:hypothetical protein